MQKKARQLNLFPDIIESAELVAVNNPRGTFYRIRIEIHANAFQVIKESGTSGRVLDTRAWPADSLKDALKMFTRRIKAKTNPNRKSPRVYVAVDKDCSEQTVSVPETEDKQAVGQN